MDSLSRNDSLAMRSRCVIFLLAHSPCLQIVDDDVPWLPLHTRTHTQKLVRSLRSSKPFSSLVLFSASQSLCEPEAPSKEASKRDDASTNCLTGLTTADSTISCRLTGIGGSRDDTLYSTLLVSTQIYTVLWGTNDPKTVGKFEHFRFPQSFGSCYRLRIIVI